MKFKKITITIAIIIVLLIVGLSLFNKQEKENKASLFEDRKTYSHTNSVSGQNSSFTFDYPKNLSVSKATDPEGEVILFIDSEKGVVIQIFVTKGERGLVLTPQILKADIPEFKTIEMSLVEVNPSIQGVLFSEDASEKIKNLWFAMGENVFQMTFYPEFEETAVLITRSFALKK